MAHTKQQRKRIRQDASRTAAKTAQRSSLRTTVKKLEAAIENGDKKTIAEHFRNAMSALAKGARKGLVTKGAAARKVSRLSARIKGRADS